VYVLEPEEVALALTLPPLSPVDVISENFSQFTFWAFIGIFMVTTVFLISISRKAENAFDPWLLKLKHYAPLVARVTVGASLVAAGHYGAIFGPELSLEATFGAIAPLVTLLLYTAGILMIAGMYVRIAALTALALFLVPTVQHGHYMFTYSNYLGEIAVLLIVGAHRVSMEHSIKEKKSGSLYQLRKQIYEWWSRHAFMILRIAFGISLIYASLYAKYIHAGLALAVVEKFNLTLYFPFAPDFLVLGASIVELLLGVFFLLGIEIRFTAIFLEIFLFLSLWFFGETVWPHIVLMGIPIAFFMYGYDKYSIEGYFFKDGDREPIF
jgi:uncharacterized membrane protein YphA (DoxX/SURF4 family)